MDDSYKIIVEHYNKCFKKHGDTHKGLNWPNEKDMDLRYKVMFELINNKSDKNVTLLDFGCGTAGLYKNLIINYKNIEYIGLDISRDYYQYCITKYPHLKFYNIDILKNNNIPMFDYIICNGVFTVKRELSYNEMKKFFMKMIKKIWNQCNIGIAFNVMSKHVDWEREDLFHLKYDDLVSFLRKNISRHFTIRNDYGLYEYTVYIYKDAYE